MTPQPLIRFAGCAALALALTACGGADPKPAAETPVVKTAAPIETSPKPPEAVKETPQKTEPAESTDTKEAPAETMSAETVDMAAMLKRGRIVWFKCRACHETDVGRRHKVGPNLHGIFDAPAAGKEDFSYSASMSEAGIIWNDETLNAFITKPASYVKGTKMAFVGISKESDRKALIEYLRKETGPK